MKETKWISVDDYEPPQNTNYDFGTIDVPVLYTSDGDKWLKLGTASADVQDGDTIWFVDGAKMPYKVMFWLEGVPDCDKWDRRVDWDWGKS